MIVDVFLYAGEAEMAVLRQMHLRRAVDMHVAVSCTLTYQGDPADRQGMEAPGGAHWVWTTADPNPDGSRGFHVEHQHRLAIPDLLARMGVGDDDVVMVSDVDEIPDADRVPEVAALARSGALVSVPMRMHGFALDYLYPGPWWGTTASLLRYSDPAHQRSVQAPLGTEAGAGWHLSWIGTPEARARKLATFSHIELAGLDTEACYRDAVHATGTPLRRLSADDVAAMRWPWSDHHLQPPAHWWAP